MGGLRFWRAIPLPSAPALLMLGGWVLFQALLEIVAPAARVETVESASRQTLHEARDQFERDLILRTLAEQQGNMSRTADVLGVERSNLYRKMKAFGIAPSRRADEETEAV
jgi:DNA-binding NtrC family response regulator